MDIIEYNIRGGETIELSGRKKKILSFIVEHYVTTAEPCGSKQIAEQGGLEVSPATIRNEMAELLEMGLLIQPHTSAGRIPSQEGYRVYVHSLMGDYRVRDEAVQKMHSFMESRVSELERIISEAGKFISEMTCYPTLAFTPKLSMQSISRFEIMPIDSTSFVLILKISNGLIKSKVCKIGTSVSQKVLRHIGKILNDRFTGIPIGTITLKTVVKLENEIAEYAFMLPPILKFICECADELNEPEIILGGERKLLSYPEFADNVKTLEFTDFLHNKEALSKLFEFSPDGESIKISIGSENKHVLLNEASVVMGNYKLGDKIVGAIAIIGPTRMDYAKVATELEYFTSELNKLLAEMFGSEKLLGGRTIESE